MFTKNIFTQKDSIADLVKPMLEAQTKTKMEELKGNQAVLDKNKNNKLDADDFKILRGEKKAVKEENVEESSPFDWKKPREPEVKGGAGIKKGRAYGGAAQKSKPEQDDADDKKKTQKEEVESKEKEDKDDVPFDGPYKKKDSAKAGKHGAGYSTARHLAQMGMKKALKKEEVEQIDEAGAQPRPIQAAAAADRDHYDKMLDDLMKSQGKRLLKKHSAEVKKSRDIESGKALTQHVKKNPGVLKTYSNAVKKDKKMYGEEVEQIDETYRLKLTKTTHPKDVTDDEDNPVKATVKHYDIHQGDKKVGTIKHHYDEYDGHSYSANLHGKNVPYERHNGTEQGAKAFIDGVAKTKWHSKNIKEEVEQVEERTLTKGETAEKERIVKGMKKSLAGFKARYGDRAKSVMYATATKAAKKD